MAKVLKGVVKRVEPGKITVRAKNGKVFTHKTDRDFHYAQEVVVWYDWHKFKVVNVVSTEEAKELMAVALPDEPEPEEEPTVEEGEESESDSSLPLRVGDEPDDSDVSDSDSDGSFQLFVGEFGLVSDES